MGSMGGVAARQALEGSQMFDDSSCKGLAMREVDVDGFIKYRTFTKTPGIYYEFSHAFHLQSATSSFCIDELSRQAETGSSRRKC